MFPPYYEFPAGDGFEKSKYKQVFALMEIDNANNQQNAGEDSYKDCRIPKAGQFGNRDFHNLAEDLAESNCIEYRGNTKAGQIYTVQHGTTLIVARKLETSENSKGCQDNAHNQVDHIYGLQVGQKGIYTVHVAIVLRTRVGLVCGI